MACEQSGLLQIDFTFCRRSDLRDHYAGHCAYAAGRSDSDRHAMAVRCGTVSLRTISIVHWAVWCAWRIQFVVSTTECGRFIIWQ